MNYMISKLNGTKNGLWGHYLFSIRSHKDKIYAFHYALGNQFDYFACISIAFRDIVMGELCDLAMKMI